MPVFESEPKKIQVRSDSTMGNKFLFNFIPSTMDIEITQRGVVYVIKLDDLLAFANKSERSVFIAKTITKDNYE